jgi:rRNA-processing protein FCF1
MHLIIDTNALIYAIKLKIDLFNKLAERNYEPIILTCVIDELDSLASRSLEHQRQGRVRKGGLAPCTGAEKQAAKLALQIISHFKITPISTKKGLADNIILDYAKDHDAIILTNDKLLKQRAKSLAIKTLSIGKNRQLR